jgi:hypothetical protein
MANDNDDDPQGEDSFHPKRPWDPEVGYGRPPKASQFKPGQSGNPNGRPKGAKTRRLAGGGYALHDAMVAEIKRMIPIREAGRAMSMSQLQAVVRQVTIKAMQGNMRAAELLLKHVALIQHEEQRLNERFLDQVLTHKAEALAEVRRRQAKGIADMSDILPHPDHIDVDLVTGEVLISGPMSQTEKDAIDAGWALFQQQKMVLAEFNKLHSEAWPPDLRKDMAKARHRLEEELRSLAEALGEPYP